MTKATPLYGGRVRPAPWRSGAWDLDLEKWASHQIPQKIPLGPDHGSPTSTKMDAPSLDSAFMQLRIEPLALIRPGIRMEQEGPRSGHRRALRYDFNQTCGTAPRLFESDTDRFSVCVLHQISYEIRSRPRSWHVLVLGKSQLCKRRKARVAP